MAKLNPVKLHAIIGASTEWTDELWDEALDYLLGHVGTTETTLMAALLPRNEPLSSFPRRVNLLYEFHKYPPTVLLGVFDCMRSQLRNRT